MLRQVASYVLTAVALVSFAVCSLPSAAAFESEGGASDAHHDTDSHGHAEGGVPISFEADLALWSLIVFVIFLVVLKKAAWGPLIEGLDKREAGIRTAIAQAEENQRKSHALLAEYETKLRDAEKTVAEMVAEAKRDAERTSQDIIAKAESEVDAMRNRAKDDIAQAKNTALSEVFGVVNAQVAMATERVLGRAMTDSDQERLVQEALSEISR
ncbi:MAG: F0F1 ATP synthase subunit B [Planctomycetaceae bacterium]|nr:F0F1 ATP synthase subunit B [Planctomycetaceae bacterium]